MQASNGSAVVYGYGFNPAPVSANVGSITRRPITVTAAADSRVYDGTTTSTAQPTLTTGFLAGIGGDTAAFTQSFDNRNAGASKTLTPTGTVNDGNGGNNYLITFAPAATGLITPRAITITAAADTKGYDGSTASAGVPTITSGTLAPVGGDVTVLSQSFDNRNAGTNKVLTPAGQVNDGNGGNNYRITYVPVTTGVINPRAVTVTAVTDARTYDGSTDSAALPLMTAGSLAPGGRRTAPHSHRTSTTAMQGVAKTLTAGRNHQRWQRRRQLHDHLRAGRQRLRSRRAPSR